MFNSERTVELLSTAYHAWKHQDDIAPHERREIEAVLRHHGLAEDDPEDGDARDQRRPD